MGGALLAIGVRVRKVVMFTIKGCHRSVCNHPFLVGFLCFLIFLYKILPSVFSLLASVSPILVCTAVLLGTLLSFGKPNIPQIEIEEKKTDEVVSLRTGLLGDATVIEGNEVHSVERFSDERSDVIEQSVKKSSLASGLDGTALLIGAVTLGSGSENRTAKEADRQLETLQQSDINEGGPGETRYAPVEKIDDLEDDKSQADSFDSERVNVDSLDSPPRSPWKHLEDQDEEEEQEEDEEEEEEEEDNEDLDSGSDGAESSSPDASMADIIPMLDELHPLLDEDAPQPALLSQDGFNAASESSSSRSPESDAETENEEDLEVADEDNEEAEDEDDIQGDKEDQTKSAITWTEEDQKNLMDLGSSEIERNQRLESLIARRRARKNLSLLPEKDLIDLESSALPFNVAPISTVRHNPFDLPNDSYDNLGLPPIPGSAPSVLLPRRNPFDIPYDSSEEKPNLMADSFQEEFMTFNPKEPFFRRHESFNIGPSIFAPKRQEKQDTKLRPYYVPEQMASEGSSYSPFLRQSSGLSDSKASSIPETESTGSAGDVEDRNLAEEDISLEPQVFVKMEDVIEEDVPRETEAISQVSDISEKDDSREAEIISNIEHVSEDVGHGSQSSEEESLVLGQIQKRDIQEELEIQLGSGQDEASEFHSKEEADGRKSSRSSSSSSLSEVSERIFTEKEGEESEGFSMVEEGRGDLAEQPHISTQPVVESTDFNISNSLADDTHKEPVYDSSPPSFTKSLSTSSVTSDVYAESDSALPPVMVKRTISFTERESEVGTGDMGKEETRNIEMSTEISKLHRGDENELGPNEIVDAREHNIATSDLSENNQLLNSAGASEIPDVSNHISVTSCAEDMVKENLARGHGSYQHVDAQNSTSSLEVYNSSRVQTATAQAVGALSMSFDDKEESSQTSGQVPSIQLSIPSLESQQTASHSINREENSHSADDKVLLSSSDVSFSNVVYHEADKNLISHHHLSGFEEKSVSHSDDEMDFSDKQMNTPPLQDPSVSAVEPMKEVRIVDSPEVKEIDPEISSSGLSSQSPESISIPSVANQSIPPPHFLDFGNRRDGEIANNDLLQAPDSHNTPTRGTDFQVDVHTVVEDADEIKEIDEQLLSELDTVGDFNVKQWGSSLSESDTRMDSVRESLSWPHSAESISASDLDEQSDEASDNKNSLYSEDLRAANFNVIDSGIRLIGDHSLGTDFTESNFQNSVDKRTSEEKPLPEESEAKHADWTGEHNLMSEENRSEIPAVGRLPSGDHESTSRLGEFTSPEAEVTIGEYEITNQGESHEGAKSLVQDVERQGLQDSGSASKQTSAEEHRVSIPRTELVLGETTAELPEDGVQHRSSSVISREMATTTSDIKSIENVNLDHKQVHIEGSGEAVGITTAEYLPLEDNKFIPEGDLEQQLKPNSEVESAEKRSDEGSSSISPESGAKEHGEPEMKMGKDHDMEKHEDVSSKKSV